MTEPSPAEPLERPESDPPSVPDPEPFEAPAGEPPEIPADPVEEPASPLTD
jgi:hypothetical protein